MKSEIKNRRTFAIISHPDAGKTTMTEKLLLFGGAIQMAGSVKAKRSKKFATSDWMELEKQRGISVTSSVMNFPYGGCEMNLIDTPGHQDFSEDTYRTLTAVDSALMLIDCANGVETQTKKLFEVCKMQKSPVMSFINKLDREGRDPFTLLEEIESVLGIRTYPVTWPLGSGGLFKGIYHREEKLVYIFDKEANRGQKAEVQKYPVDDPRLVDIVGEEIWQQFSEEIELVEGAGDSFESDEYMAGEIAPVFFGTALFSFGIEPLLKYLVKVAPCPLPREAVERKVDPFEKNFSAVVFKIQANMDPSHRDRVAFMRICSGKFERGMKSHHVRLNRQMRLGRPTQFMAQDRSLVDEAFAGDIVGIHDPGVFAIGDSLTKGENLHFKGIPVFAPELFMRVELAEPMKSKQLSKALNQLSEEGAVQVFRPIRSNDQYLGVVGQLQFDVVQYRIKAEYGVEVRLKPLVYSAARWIHSKDETSLDKFVQEQAQHICEDQHQKRAILLDHDWRIKFHLDRHPDIEFAAASSK